MRSALFAAVSGLAALAQAYTTPTTQIAGTGNSIYTPGLNQAVPAGSPFNITWNPTTQGTVTIVLMRGPGDNIKPLYPIVEKTPNTGSFVWTPSTDLVPDVTHYGLQLIDDATGQYQWSTQFGISNPGYTGSSGTASGSTATATSTTTTASATGGSSNSTATGSSGTTPSSVTPSNGTIVAPTRSSSAGTTLVTGATTRTVTSATKSATTASASAVTSNAAVAQKVGSALGFVGVIAALAL